MTTKDTVKVRFYFCGVYQGIREIDADSICGRLIRGNFAGATAQLGEMVDELNAIPGVKASANVDTGKASEH